jgi:hypothetical protein
VSFAVVHSHGQTRERQIASINALSSLAYPSQTNRAGQFCTKKGFQLLPSLVQESGELCFSHFTRVGFKTNPGMCDVEMVQESADGKSRIYVRLIKQDIWRFDDVKLVELEGNEINLWLSRVVENPDLLKAKLIAGQVGSAWKAAMGFSEELKHTVENIQSVKQLFEPSAKCSESNSFGISPLLF